MFNETAGETATAYNKSISEVRFSGNRVYTSARRFVVVRVKREFCYACPIFTYSNRATTKDGVRPEEHGVVYSYGREAKLVDDERGIVKPSIAVEMASGEPPLHVASRIYYGIHHPVQYNVKVKHIGQVIDNHLPALIGNWKAEDNGETKQAADVTASADDDDLPEIPEERLSEENAPYSKSLGKTPAKEAPPRPPSPDMFLYHPTNNIYGFDKKINPQVYHPVQNPYGYHPTHNQLGYHPSSTPYNYHPDHNIYGYHPEYNPHGYHPTANITGYHPSTNLYSYHPLHNSIGHHSSSNPYSYHPIHNPHGYHPQKAPFCWHPQLCPYGYHAQRNPSGFHPLVMPGNFHPEVNPLGYHPSHKAHEYHPRHNMYAYHKTHNPSGFHPKHNAYGYHPTQNQHAYHAQQNPFGYHPTYYPNSYHPTYQPAGTLYDRSGKIIEDSDDEDPDEGETGDEHEDEDEDEDENDDADELYVG
ncbi:hypothetical protein DE146DRAFT_327526 [Phaeosphaeria sp. MPI-PUGE-AT-0046c]|nr:hypothetical protein DE146DRAFT_327526 [Phaeosphaeria sp. MPI-PUGE-AT-0046c]